MSESSDSTPATEDSTVIRWLLEDDQPVAQYYTLIDLLGRTGDDPEVRSARSRIARAGWAYDQLRSQGSKGFWEAHEPKNVGEWVNFLYFPTFRATNWRALVLSDFGLDATNPRIKKIAELIFEYKLRRSSPFNFFHEEACISANTARMMTRFGYADDIRVRKLYDWLLEDPRENGGWNCSQDTPGTLDVWEPLAAFAALPKAKRSPKMERAISKGAEFYLDRKLFQEGRPYAPWLRLHYPNHYFYDILIGLDVLTDLGFGGDRRLRPALKILMEKRRRDGTWLMDRSHPDLGPGTTIHPDKNKIRPLVIEEPGRPSKWITLKALRVRKRVEDAG
ncbi:MAG: hypothetical protein HKL79_00110 [Thermoplasmata archaeon]|nr:hypothetical protein [Thermoplasmata archaeon]